MLRVPREQLEQVVKRNCDENLKEFNGISFKFLELTPEVNDRVIVKSAAGSKVGVLRYRGEPHFASGIWCGVEFDDAVGKNDGSVSGQR